MEIIPEQLFREMESSITKEECAEMAIPSYTHKNIVMRRVAYSRIKLLIDWMINYQDDFSNIIDFGCGTGILLPSASNRAEKVYGIDLTLAPAKILVDHYNLANVVLLAPEIAMQEIPDKSIDIILCGEVLEHIQDLNATLTQFKRMARNNAHLLITLPTENKLYKLGRKLAGFSGEYHLQDSLEIQEIIIQMGFEQVRRKSLPLFGPFAIYWVIDYVWNEKN
jgi:2-polyprenyl-3-methyl-5-hydroxy-6-metoxy-1,4-benzoquinol methylase